MLFLAGEKVGQVQTSIEPREGSHPHDSGDQQLDGPIDFLGRRCAADLAADRMMSGLGPADRLQHVVGVPVRFTGGTVAEGDLRDRGDQPLGVDAFEA